MGVDNFFKITFKQDGESRVIGELGRKVALKRFKKQRICIDASGMIYNAILAMEYLHSLTDKSGRITAHINTIFNKIIQLDNEEIEQIWIFDSPEPNELKRHALERRAARRAKAEADGNQKTAYRLNKEHVEDIQNLLRYMGKMYITAPPGIEAEQYGAFMTKGSKDTRFCQYMISADSDVLCFGGNLLRVSTEKVGHGI